MSNDLTSLTVRLRDHVAALAKTPRTPGTPEHERANTYIRQHLERCGFNVVEERDHIEGMPCRNLLGEWPLATGDDLPMLIVGAHYDSIPNSPGADDNASAVAALLELGRWLATELRTIRATRRIQLVAYDLEEYGIVGSRFHAQRLRQSQAQIAGMISLEMLGYIDEAPGSQQLPPALAHLYPNVGNFIGICGNESSAAFTGTVTAAMKSVDDLPVEFIIVPGDGEMLPEVRLSDHSSFWDLGYPALMITDTSFFRNPHYHQSSDTPETLNYRFLAKVTRGVCAAVLRLLTAEVR